MLKRVSFFVYGCLSYLIFLGTFLYAIAFVGGFLVPTRLDGAPIAPFGTSLAIDLVLLTVFAVQHSVMARRGFKAWSARFVPREIERSTYVLCASAALMLLFALWRPLGGELWNIQGAGGRLALAAVCASGWMLVLLATFLINHFDLFGLRQVWFAFHGKPYVPVALATPWLYRIVRHPLYLGFLLAFWAAPTMTLAHLVFAVTTTAYILVAIQLEERDLVAEHGVEYETYRRRVPMLLPRARGTAVSAPAVRLAARDVVTRHLLVLIVPCLAVLGVESLSAQTRVPPVPTKIEVADGFSLFFSAHAIGTQNYVCVPAGAALAWKPIGPQATLFQTFFGGFRQQVATHFLSANADEGGLARATWQHSLDSSRVWAKAIETSSDPAFVAANAIPWLKLERVGFESGPAGGFFLTQARYIQRLNTSGGLAPAAGCAQATDVGVMALVPYEADYFFYKANPPR